VRIDRQRVADHRGRLLFEVETAELWDGYAEPVPTLLDALDEAGTGAGHAGAIEEVVLKSWSHGHVLLIGDAAHATSPNMAQGAAMALEDALVLAGSLNSCHSCRRLFRLACSDPTGAARPGTFVRQLLYTCQTQ
jgi:2-polyprenyl-6-methoxyphenol hydroxylase-like FAD-dependent oxidoreductase